MKIRIKFSKQGEMKFIGHLDLMRFFQKAIRRAKIDIRFSEGLSPHMIMSFASPLGVGITSSGEYVDIEINTPVSTQEALKKLNREMADGIRILDFRKIEEGKASKAMSIVAGADYTVKFRHPSDAPDRWQEQIPLFLASEHIYVTRESKKGETVADIRPMIFRMEGADDSLFLRLSAGSAANLKPETLMAAFFSFLKTELKDHALLINREDLYAEGFISLNDLGTVIL